MLIAEAVDVFPVMLGCKRMISVGYSSFVGFISVGGILDLQPDSVTAFKSVRRMAHGASSRIGSASTYVEINIQVPSTSKLPVSYLKSNSHFVIFVQLFVETFFAMSSKLNVMSHSSSKVTARYE
ncbi:hypothetical protein ACMFMG_008905 [Clarireedia jacksonii]